MSNHVLLSPSKPVGNGPGFLIRPRTAIGRLETWHAGFRLVRSYHPDYVPNPLVRCIALDVRLRSCSIGHGDCLSDGLPPF